MELSISKILSLKDTIILPGSSAHQLMAPINRVVNPDLIQNKESYRSSAVAIIITEINGRIKSILIERPEYDGVHSRQIALPGGKMDSTDTSLLQTAQRECMEEINLHPNLMQDVATLSPIYIPVSGFKVQPYIFYVEDLPSLIPEEREVESIIIYDLHDIVNDSNIKSKTMKFSNNFVQKDVPYFEIEGYTVWGATAMILAEFRQLLLNA